MTARKYGTRRNHIAAAAFLTWQRNQAGLDHSLQDLLRDGTAVRKSGEYYAEASAKSRDMMDRHEAIALGRSARRISLSRETENVRQ